VVRFSTHNGSRDKDRALIAEGWGRYRPDQRDDAVVAVLDPRHG
jgi:hypothetical protein